MQRYLAAADDRSGSMGNMAGAGTSPGVARVKAYETPCMDRRDIDMCGRRRPRELGHRGLKPTCKTGPPCAVGTDGTGDGHVRGERVVQQKADKLR